MKKILVLLSMLVAMNASGQWVNLNNPSSYKRIVCLASSGTNLYAATYGDGVFLSTNSGINWTTVNNGLNEIDLYEHSISFSGTNTYLATQFSGVLLSTNNGTNWTSIRNGLPNVGIYAFKVFGTNLFAGTDGVYLSTNNGTSWISTGLTNLSIFSLAVLGTSLYAGTSNGSVYVTTNNGINWNSVSNGLPNQAIYALTVSGANLFAGIAGGGVFLSTNNGTSWNAVNNGLTNLNVRTFVVLETNLIAGTGRGVFLSTNEGANWLSKNQGFDSIPLIDALLIKDGNLFAGTCLTLPIIPGGYYEVYSIWRRSLSEIIGIQNISTETPSKYSLLQNYPNPFNPITNVKFSIVNAGQVKLIVYDVQGREVQTLVNERLQPGTYEAAFDGSMQNSGVYFYKLVTDGFSETKKMLLIK